jgi:hypothetical protein
MAFAFFAFPILQGFFVFDDFVPDVLYSLFDSSYANLFTVVFNGDFFCGKVNASVLDAFFVVYGFFYAFSAVNAAHAADVEGNFFIFLAHVVASPYREPL